MSDYERASRAAERLAGYLTRTPTLAVVLGSGLAPFADRLAGVVSLPYSALPDWPVATVPGHEGRLLVGEVRGKTVAVLAGRAHLYEGHDARAVTLPIRTLAVLGVRTIVLTNASGGIRPGLEAGILAVIDDHINLTGHNPLVGEHDDRLGPRFPDMTQVYSPRARRLADESAAALGIGLAHGIYAGVLGPCYETPAEVRFLAAAGADMVGMSTVLEAIVATQMGLEVLGLSCVTNAAARVDGGPLSHADVLQAARQAGVRMSQLLEEIIARA